MMFNPDWKDNFKNYCLETGAYGASTLKTPIKALFNNTFSFESKQGKDLAEFNSKQVEELIEYLSHIYKTRESLSGIRSLLFSYFNWCTKEGLTNSPIDLYDITTIKNIIQKVIPDTVYGRKYFSKGKMQRYIDDITDVTCKFVAYAWFFNIKGDNEGDEYLELTHIKMSDLNEETKMLSLCTNRDVEVDDFFISLMKRANEATYYDEDGDYTPNKAGIYDYVPSDYVLKQMRFSGGFAEPLTKTMMMKKIGVIKRQCSHGNMCHTTASTNGLVYYIQKKYNERGISLERAILTDKPNGKLYTHDGTTEEFIHAFRLNKKVKSLRIEIRQYIDNFLENEIEDIKYNVSAIPEIRVIDLGIDNETAEEIQSKIILGSILEREQCTYEYGKHILSWENNTVVLFSNHGEILACARLNKIDESCKHMCILCLYPESIQVFSPFTLENLKELYPNLIFFKNELFQKPSVTDIADLFNMIKLNSEKYDLAVQGEEVTEKVTEENARHLDIEELLNRIENGRKTAYYGIKTTSSRQHRDIYLKKLVKILAEGNCQLCEQSAPFNDTHDEPYLEEHHVVKLADDGKDILDNVVAICPNCHRKSHILVDDKDVKKLSSIAMKNVYILERKRIKLVQGKK